MVLVGSVDGAVLDAVLDVGVVLACKSTNSFCKAELKLDPLVEFTAPVLLLSVVLDGEPLGNDDDWNEVLVVLLLLPVTLLYRS